jgi:hypothetical protein
MEMKSKVSDLNRLGRRLVDRAGRNSEYMRFSGTLLFLISESELLKSRLCFP